MIGAGVSYYNEEAVQSYLDGNAKIYDGSFDYDTFNTWSTIFKASTISIFIALKATVSTRSGIQFIAAQGDNLSSNNSNLIVYLDNGRLHFYLQSSGGLLLVRSNNIVAIGDNRLSITYDGSGTAAGVAFYEAGVAVGITTISNTLSGELLATTIFRIGARIDAFFKLNANIGQLEIINSVASGAQQLAAAETGSFRGAGISHASGQYLLAVDTDKVNGQNLTTFAGTPSYTITAIGGATYTPYL